MEPCQADFQFFFFAGSERVENRVFAAQKAVSASRGLWKLEPHLLYTGRFALGKDGQVIAEHIRRFLTTNASHGLQGRG